MNQLARVTVDPNPVTVDKDFAGGGLSDNRWQNISEVLSTELLQKLHDWHLRCSRCYVRHQSHVFDQPHSLTLRRLRRANHTPVGVMELARLGLFPCTGKRRVGTTEVGEGRGVGEAIQHLRDTSLGCVSLISPCGAVVDL